MIWICKECGEKQNPPGHTEEQEIVRFCPACEKETTFERWRSKPPKK